MTSIILADNQAVFRAGAARILARDGDFQVAAQCTDATGMRVAVAAHPRSIVLWSSTLTVISAHMIEHLKSFESRGIVLVEVGEDAHTHIAAEVHGILDRAVTASTLCEACRVVARGGRYIHSRCGDAIDNSGRKIYDRLTNRERQIVSILIQGERNKQIASQLGTSEQMVKNQLRSVYDKVGVNDRLELVLFVFHHPALKQELTNAYGGLSRNYRKTCTPVSEAPAV